MKISEGATAYFKYYEEPKDASGVEVPYRDAVLELEVEEKDVFLLLVILNESRFCGINIDSRKADAG